MDKEVNFDSLLEGVDLEFEEDLDNTSLSEAELETLSFEDIEETFDNVHSKIVEDHFFSELEEFPDEEELEESAMDIDELDFHVDEEIDIQAIDALIESARAEVEETEDLQLLGESEEFATELFETVEGDRLIEEMINRESLHADLDMLEEAGVNQVRLSYEAKRKRIESQSAMILAKEANDIMYTRYVKFNRLRKQLKDQIKQKYAGPAAVRAKQVMSRTGKLK